ncbi:hypothetical protein HQ42_07810 [Porphyromonas gulae]|uniref:hypothetical protein n=1 Tax=Porphyromonas gulae TaxID=111105 RepID=UPI00052C658A|nr:hypothetical protein [Porphyromonas gulae]KGO02220.1 hypothetical protein HQ42_07810 [Porphyromonas gulae]
MDKLIMISCQDNKISKLDISNKPELYIHLRSQEQYQRGRNGRDREESLPQMTLQSPGALFAAVLSASEGNIITPDHAARAKAKK